MTRTKGMLDTRDHDRNSAGLAYVYPVISRRAGGVSIGVNLNPNNACNWRCIYCQVPGLVRGSAPEVDLKLLADELNGFLDQILHGSFMEDAVPEDCRVLRDIAISGNGEPTSSGQFGDVVRLIGRIMQEHDLIGEIRLVLITNGSYMAKPHVQKSLERMRSLGGEVWIKVDAVSAESVARINGVQLGAPQLRRQVVTAARCCPTWIQSCMFALDGEPPGEADIRAYLGFIASLVEERIPLRGVLLYGLARPSMQPEAGRLSAVDDIWMRNLADRIRELGVGVRLSP
jgi:wyosine [tRNA(Phe)-imidazoG37] synthetase (radical SAM superfamily)